MNQENNQVSEPTIPSASTIITFSPNAGEILPVEQPIISQPATTSAPIISALEPPVGAVRRSTSVTIKGKNFVTGSQVKFGNLDAAEVTFKSSEELIAVTPSKSELGTVNVQVVNPDGQTSVPEKTFQYVAPQTGAIKFTDAELLDTSPNIIGDGETAINVGIGSDNSGFGTIRAGQSASITGQYELIAIICNQFGCFPVGLNDLVNPTVGGTPPASQVSFNPNPPILTFDPVVVTLSTSISTPPGSYSVSIGG
ncbi:MAG: hypothetical protein HC930_10120, partial [Hydrococcus sp. SU_1_0]|nr:hypothetical protein [Hydrococcus sp. SU_1_0]